MTYQLSVQYFEIYLEKIYDLVNYTDKGYSMIAVQKDRRGDIKVPVKAHLVKSFNDVCKILKIGQKNRKEASTFNNERSSRSHTVFAIEVLSQNHKGRVKRAKLNLIDLAGSERIANLGESETLQKECTNINKSLLHLSRCIKLLSEGEKKVNIPYRDSILTRYLTDTLGGKCNTALICTISRLKSKETYTKMTLEFGMWAQKIKTTPVAQVEYSVSELKQKIKKLEEENKDLKTKIRQLLEKLNSASSQDILAEIHNEMNQLSGIKEDDLIMDDSILESSSVSPLELDKTINDDLNQLEPVEEEPELDKLAMLKEELEFERDLKDQAVERSKALEEEVFNLKTQLDSHLSENKKLQERVSELETQLRNREEATVEITEMMNESTHKIQQLEEKNLQLENEVGEAKIKLDEVNNDLQEVSQKLEVVTRQNVESIQELLGLKAQLEAKTTAFENEISEKNSKINVQKTEIEILKKQLEADSSKMDEAIV